MHNPNYRLLHHEGDVAIDNDLMVGGSLAVAQHARFKRTLYVEGTLVYRHLRGMDCGLFDTIEALQHVHPSPRRGQWAIVGTTVDQLALYACQTHGLWTMLSDGQTLAEALHYDDIITGPITLDKVPEIQQYIDTLVRTEREAREAAITAEQQAREAAIAALKAEIGLSNTPNTPNNPTTPTTPDDPDFHDPLRPEYYLEINGQRVRDNAALQAQVKWGIPFYEWPLRCYNGNVSFVQYLSEGAENIEVFAPGERIVYKMGVTIDHTTNDVYFNISTKAFVLKVGSIYYSLWGNSSEWNDPVTGKARTDCVFSDISRDPSVSAATLFNERTFIVHRDTDVSDIDHIPRGTQNWSEDQVTNIDQAKRISCIFDPETQAMVDINTLMTDFTAAVHAAALANNGSLRLSRRIYFMGNFIDNSNAKINISQQEGFLIDGQGGTLFVRRPNEGTGHPQQGVSGAHRSVETILLKAEEAKATCQSRYEAYIAEHPTELDYDPTITLSPYNSDDHPTGTTVLPATLINISRSSGTIRDITIAALRDKDNGAPGGHWRMSSSDSRINGIDLAAETNYANHDITIRDITFHGMYEDIRSHSGTNSSNSNVLIDGWTSRECTQNVPNGFGWTIRRADVRQNDYVGAGVHIMYGQGKLTGLWVEDSRFYAGRYSSVMITMHELNGSAGNYSHARDIHFSRCELHGCQLYGGAGYSGWCHFHDCTFMQTHDTIVNNDNEEVQANAINMKFTNMWFSNCHFNLYRHALANTGATTVRAVFENCSIVTHDVTSVVASSFAGIIYHKEMELPFKPGTTTPIDWGVSDLRVGTIALFSGVRDDDGKLITKLPDIITNRVKKASTRGTTAQRPTDVEPGFCYFDTSIGSGTPPKGKPIWASKVTEITDAVSGEVTREITWVDATGITV